MFRVSVFFILFLVCAQLCLVFPLIPLRLLTLARFTVRYHCHYLRKEL